MRAKNLIAAGTVLSAAIVGASGLAARAGSHPAAAITVAGLAPQSAQAAGVASFGADSIGHAIPLVASGGGSPSTTTAPTTTVAPPTSTVAPTTVPTSTVPPTTVVPPTSTVPTTSTTVPSGGTTLPVGDLFGSFDTPLSPSAPVANDSAALAADIINQYQTHYGDFGIQDQYPIVTVGAGQAGVYVSVLPGCNNFEPNVGNVPIPSSAASILTGSSDNPLMVWQPSTESEWEFWRVSYTNGAWSACWGGKITNVGSSAGLFTEPYGVSASGLSYLALTITEADVASGSIDHPIAIQMPLCNSMVSPATRTDCPGNAGTPSEGMLFRLPANLAMPAGLTPFAQLVFRALQNYGAYMTDRAGAVVVVAENPGAWAADGNGGADPITTSWAGAPQYNAMAGMPWGSLQHVLLP